MKLRYLHLLSVFLVRLAAAQCSANQPPNNIFSLPAGVTAYYALDGSLNSLPQAGGGTPSPVSQIQTAIKNWSTAQNGPGGAGTTLLPATAANHATVTFNQSQTPAPASLGGSSYVQAGTFAASGLAGTAANPVTITFFPQSLLQGTSSNAYQAAAANYGTMYAHVAAHELGHLMGIGDYPANAIPPSSPTSSVVMPTLGVNDIYDTFQKLGPTPCDIAQAYTVEHMFQAANSPKGTPGPHVIWMDPGPGAGDGGYCAFMETFSDPTQFVVSVTIYY